MSRLTRSAPFMLVAFIAGTDGAVDAGAGWHELDLSASGEIGVHDFAADKYKKATARRMIRKEVEFLKDENTAMTSIDSEAAKDHLQGNLTAQVGSDKPLIHILSMGRTGSCFALSLYASCGFMTVFEPLHGLIEGSRVLSPTHANVFDCLYGCQCHGHVVNDKASKVMDKYCPNPSAQRLAIKDCRVINYKAYQTYTHPDLLKKVKYVLLLRDPRGVWQSLMKFTGWAIHSIPLVCEILHTQVQTLPNLREAVGSSNIHIEIMEKWSQDVKAFARRLAAFSGEEVSEKALEAAQKAQDARGTDGAGKWKSLVPDAQIKMIESHPKCSAYMDFMGYKKGSNDYSQVREPSELGFKEINLLSSSRRVDDSQELSIEELFSSLPEEVIEVLMPSKMPAFPTLED